MKPGERTEKWHTDGGASVIHAGFTIFGHRVVEVENGNPGTDSTTALHQRPGSIYVGNFCALKHRVCHSAESGGCYGPSGKEVKIAIMMRADYFRNARATLIHKTPGPGELFAVANAEVVKQIDQMPFYSPTLDEVLAEARALGFTNSDCAKKDAS